MNELKVKWTAQLDILTEINERTKKDGDLRNINSIKNVLDAKILALGEMLGQLEDGPSAGDVIEKLGITIDTNYPTDERKKE